MNTFMLPLFVLILHRVQTASIPPQESPEDIKYNLVSYENNLIEGMIPPLPQAPEHYSPGKSFRESQTSYVVEISRKYLNFKTTGFPSQKIKLTQNETEGIQKLSLRFVELLNSSKLSSEPETETETSDWRNLNPIIRLSQSGISLQFLEEEEEEGGENEETESRDILWDFLTKYARNIFEEKVRELKVEEKFADVVGSLAGEGGENSTAFENFQNAMWKIMKLSVEYAETAFEKWEKSTETTTATATEEEKREEKEETFRPTISTVFAYEEPSPFHIFPSEEFEHRRKDIDLIFYGRGII